MTALLPRRARHVPAASRRLAAVSCQGDVSQAGLQPQRCERCCSFWRSNVTPRRSGASAMQLCDVAQRGQNFGHPAWAAARLCSGPQKESCSGPDGSSCRETASLQTLRVGASVLHTASLSAALALLASRGLEFTSDAGSRLIAHTDWYLRALSAAHAGSYVQAVPRAKEQSAALRESLLVVAHGSNNRHTARLA